MNTFELGSTITIVKAETLLSEWPGLYEYLGITRGQQFIVTDLDADGDVMGLRFESPGGNVEYTHDDLLETGYGCWFMRDDIVSKYIEVTPASKVDRQETAIAKAMALFEEGMKILREASDAA